MILASQLPSPKSVDEWIRHYWRIKPDPPGLEYIEAPDFQLCQFFNRGYLEGDCDDAATLAGSILAANAIPCWFVAVQFPQDREFSHVFCQTMDRDIDPIAPVGVLPHRNIVREMRLEV